jgi:hypothetical protein
LPWRPTSSPSWTTPSPSEHTTALPRPHVSLPAPQHAVSCFHLAGTGAPAASDPPGRRTPLPAAPPRRLSPEIDHR